MYKVRLQSFEGPFDLLVYLIETAEMSIYDIKISQITNQYLEYMQAMKERDVFVSTEFMVLAASLIEIKSKMILPRVSQEDGALLGYAYAHPYAARPAYQWSAELTVYLRQGAARRGLGSRLYGALFDLLRLQGVRTVYGCVTAENAPSVAFHQALGFREAGRFFQVGYNHGRWLDVLWLDKPIAPAGEPQPLVPFPQVEEEAAAQVLRRWGEARP